MFDCRETQGPDRTSEDHEHRLAEYGVDLRERWRVRVGFDGEQLLVGGVMQRGVPDEDLDLTAEGRGLVLYGVEDGPCRSPMR